MARKPHQILHLSLGIIASLVVARTILVWKGQIPIYFFFTLQTNLLVALYWLWSGVGLGIKYPKPTLWICGAVTTYITITAVVYLVVLHGTFLRIVGSSLAAGHFTKWQYFVECFMNYMLHIFIPILILIDYVLFTPHDNTIKPYWWLIYPVVYGGFHTIYGIKSWRYIYPFLDPYKSGGWLKMGINGLIVLALFMIVGYGIYYLNRVVNRKRAARKKRLADKEAA